ncbi:MAG: glycoside hydrolase family 15 protein [Bryobacteraceae bacterium]
MSPPGYKPIESYGIIGDLHSVALIGLDGSIDWCCLPRFDSPSVFAAILDQRKGGYFRVTATHHGARKQMYLPATNVLLTRFLGIEGVGEVTDFMPVQTGASREQGCRHQIVRIARAVRGSVHFRLECCPAFDYARCGHEVTFFDRGVVFDSLSGRLILFSPVPLGALGTGAAADFVLEQGESATFVLRYPESDGGTLTDAPTPGEEALQETVAFWRGWLDQSSYQGRWREMVHRSALVLKLLTYEPTGAIVAAPTCSLPEEVGGRRNWDYRYTWIRDAAFTVYAFLRLGFLGEATRFMDWLQKRVREEEQINGPLNIMYGIDGRHELPEECLDHLEGYRGSKPVHIGNAACSQLQLDIYGTVIDSLYLCDKYVIPVTYDLWKQIRRMLDWVSRNWELPDEGIWEVRGGRQDFVYSKLQCWVALDRGLRMAQKRGLPLDHLRLRAERDRIHEAIMNQGWDPARQAFIQHFGSRAIDASSLLMPLVFFVSPKDPRMLATVERVKEELVSDSLVHRYRIGEGADDGLTGKEGTFSMCTFWLVEALASAGRMDEARFIFEKMLTYANHLGLYAEQIGPSGEALGNFPQALTHLALISAAFNLDRKLGTRSVAASR